MEKTLGKGTKERFITDASGRKVSVIVNYARYQRLMEDMHDLAVIAERRAEKPISLTEMKSRLRKNGQL